jgi:LysR family transcriptional regulator, glycine cleavage system transcriptional activator
MRRRVPLNAIRAFEAAARHRSVTQAANELHVTPTAVSHQIKFLENFLQSKLFIRRNSRLELTPDSEACLTKISDALDLIDNALVQLKHPEERRERFIVGASASFTSLWLMPRIQSFMQGAPEIDITLKTFLHRAAIESEQPDLQICNWETSLDRKIEPLMDEEVIPVCSPELAAQHGGISPGLLEQLPLIHFERRIPAINGQYPDWAHYFREFGVHHDDLTQGPKFNHNVAAIDAARAGLGVLLARSVLVEGYIQRKELVQVGEAYPIRSRYYLVTPWQPEAPRALSRFKEWLYNQVATSKRVHVF